MAGVLQHLRSSTLNKRPNPASMVDGQLAINYASGSPGAFFKDSNGNLVKVGPVHVGATAPNVSPASGGTAGNSLGEQWLDTSGGTYVFKIWDGTAWRSEAGEFVNVTGDTMTGALGVIAGSASTPGLFFSGDANSGLYSPGADQVAISTGGSGRLFVDASGRVGVGTSPSYALHVSGTGAVSSRTFATDATGDASFFVQNDGNGICGPLVYGSTKTAYGALASNETAFYSNRSTTIMADGASAVIKFATGGNNERLRITSAGLVGIGTSSPSYALQVAETSAVVSAASYSTFFGQGTRADLVLQATSSNNDQQRQVIRSNSDSLIFGTENAAVTTFTEKLRIDSSGRVGIGTSSPSATTKMSIVDSTSAGIYLLRTAQGETVIENTGSLTIRQSSGNSANQYIFFKTGASVGTEGTAMTIDGSQRVGIGTADVGSYSTYGNKLVIYGTGTNGPGMTIATGTSDTGSIYFADGTTGNQVARGAVQYAHADDALLFQTAATERFRCDSSGRLLVGTSSTSATTGLLVQGSNGGSAAPGIIRACYTTATPANGDAFGYLVFGDSAHADAAWVAAERDGGTWSGTSKPTRLVFSTTADGASSPTERMRITSGGDLLIGQQTNPATSRVAVQVQTGTANGINAQITSNTGTSYPWSNYNASGTYVGGITCTSTATSFPTSSDYRLKTNIQPLTGAISLVSQLKPSTFEFNENPGETVQGFIAHELQEVVPLAVIGEKDAEDANGNPVYQGVDAAKLVPLLTAALQEAVAKIEGLEARLTAAGV
jgi:hypothetical protein